ncbi:efflux RND transporter periplasmic adaptor subunit [bacterium]|nr:efflux RND transporter periplasmic adaptor subunit [bacterium]
MKKGLIIVIILFVFIAIVLLAGIAVKKRSHSAIEVQTEKVAKRDIAQVVTAFGRLSPEVEVDISARVMGQIEKIYVEEGDTVVKGDTLARIERKRYIAALKSARASLSSARAQLDRANVNLGQARDSERKTQSMFDKKLVSEDALTKASIQVELLEAEYISARDGIERAKAALDEAQDNLDQTTLLAPVSGVVVKLYVDTGENVITGTTNVPGSTIMTVAQLDAMEAVVSVDEADVVDLDIGQKARVKVDAFPDTFLVGSVVKIANRATLQNIGGQETVANFEVKIAIADKFDKIRPGMSCSGEIEVAKADSVLAVPIQAVVAAKKKVANIPEAAPGTAKPKIEVGHRRDVPREKPEKAGEAVFVVKNGIAKQNPVKTGIADDRYIEIKEGLEGGEEVVIGRYKALRELKDGDRVKVIGNERKKGSPNARFN